MKIWAPHQGLLDRMATVSTRIPRPKTGWRIVLIIAGLLGSVTEVQLCDVSGCRPTGEISLLLLGVVIFSAGMVAFSSVLERQRLGSGAAAPMWLIRSAHWAPFLGLIEMCVAGHRTGSAHCCSRRRARGPPDHLFV